MPLPSLHLTQQQQGGCPVLSPLHLPSSHSFFQTCWGSTPAAAEVCAPPAFPPRPSTPTHPANHSTWPSSLPEDPGCAAASQAHAGLTHAHLVAWHTGLCAAMAKCPLPDTVRAVCSPADGRRWGPELLLVLEVRARWREGSLAGRQEML